MCMVNARTVRIVLTYIVILGMLYIYPTYTYAGKVHT